MINRSKIIVVTGASSGIGYELAKKLAYKGHQVYAIARNKAKLEELAKQVGSSGEIIPVPMDLSRLNKKQLDEHFNQIKSIDVLVNNAGKLLNKKFLEITEEEIKEVFDLNYVSVVKMIQYFYSRLKEADKSHIVNIGSVGGVTGSVKFPGLSIYSSSKGALSILSECLAQDFKEDDISVNCLALGSVNTKMLNEAFPDFHSPTSPDEMAEYITEFVLNAHQVINGVTQSVSVTNP